MLKIANRISALGTETAFAVSEEAAAFAALGNKVYPFHLGDLNFRTPTKIVEATRRAIEEGKTGYCPTRGITPLREVLAADVNTPRGTHYKVDNVAVQPGGKPTIGKFVLALMNPGDEVLYPNPGYPIYESQISFNGGIPIPYSFIEDRDRFRLDIEGLRRQITKRTRMLVINSPQNPTAAEYNKDELEQLAEIAMANDLVVLSDEAYFDIRYEGKSQSIASLPGMEERTVILYTFSKKFAMSGWRLGATIGPAEVINVVAKLNVNDESCSNHFIQYGAVAGLSSEQPEVKQQLNVLKERRDVAHDILTSIPGIRCLLPQTTFYLYPNVTGLMRDKGYADYESFRKDILEHTGVSFCTRMHFGRPSEGERERYVRFAYSGIDVAAIREGLGKMKQYLMK
ncbi:MAG: aminotransferase class I/II-fold pyridoxal phosphate-dependent enzyme [Cyclobacteriaceae bacterium]|nr:aminotransferase class I/II-fold pyridoxal phosphate-dependent enzyme [Cyclobacteriaceae bacterium]